MSEQVMYRVNTEGVIEDCSDCECRSSSSDDDGDDQIFANDTTFTAKTNQKEIRTLEDLPWFHGDMTRNTAEALLLANGVEGTYLMRRSRNNPGTYTVSVRCKDSLKHFPLEYNHYAKTYTFGMGQFDSLNELLEHFNCIPVLGDDSGDSVTLKHPYSNDIPEPSSYAKVTRHAEFGKISVEKKNKPLQDLHIASKEGYLVKRGAIHKNWKRRWFVLQKNLLKYFADRNDTSPIRSLDLTEAVLVSEDFCDNKQNCFRSLHQQYYLYSGRENP